MTRAGDLPLESSNASLPTLLLTIVVVGAAFFLAEHEFGMSTLEEFNFTTEMIEDAGSQGTTSRRVAFTAIALLGLYFLVRRSGPRLKPQGLLPWLLFLTFAWLVASVLWSADVALSIRRLGILAFCLLGALGLGRQLSLRDLCVLTLVLTAGYALIGGARELALGTFRPFSTGYRFAGTCHPNGQSANCALMCLAAVSLAAGVRRGRYFLFAVAILGVSLAVLTKSRTGLAALVVAIGAFWALQCSTHQRLFYGMLAVWLVCSITLGVALLEGDVGGRMTDVILLGREKEQAGSLTGRVPLWTELLHLARQRPMLGYGYGSFWSAEHIEAASEAVGSAGVPHAHSAYLEILLQAGLVGAALLLLVALVGIARAAATYRTTGDSGAAFFFAVMAYGLVHSALESGFAVPSFAPFLAGCGLSHMAFYGRNQTVLAEHNRPLASPLAVATLHRHLMEGRIGS